MKKNLDEFEFSTKARKALSAMQITTVEQLMKVTYLDVRRMSGAGRGTGEEIQNAIRQEAIARAPERDILKLEISRDHENVLRKNGIETIDDMLKLEIEDFMRFEGVGKITARDFYNLARGVKEKDLHKFEKLRREAYKQGYNDAIKSIRLKLSAMVK